MKVFYFGNKDIIIPFMAALIRANRLPREPLPSISEIKKRMDEYDLYPHEGGIPYFIGLDNQGNSIYCLDLRKSGNLGFQAIEGIGGKNLPDWSFHQSPLSKGWFIPLGKILCQLKKKTLGNTLIGKGIQKEYVKIVAFVNNHPEKK